VVDGDETGLSDTGRTEAFSDGVMAIAITLLILDVRVDDESGKGLLHDLLHIWPTYAAYLASFLTIEIIWMNHHGFFRQVRALDRRMQWWNLVLLLAISWLPFPTALVAEHIRDGDADARTAIVVYALSSVAMTVPWVFLWRRLELHPELFAGDRDAAHARTEGKRAWLGVGLYLVCAAVGLVSAYAAAALLAALAVFYALTSQGWAPLARDRPTDATAHPAPGDG
jgi:uncharacterized membrane protein